MFGRRKGAIMDFWEGDLPAPDIRTIDDMRSVLRDQDCNKTGPLYFMYRDLALSTADRRWMSEHKLMYDITVIRPVNLCGEKAKTKGHYHPQNASGTGFPEIYEVIEGQAHYLLQRSDLTDAALICAVRGELVIVPPGYGHVTINSGSTDLVMANFVSSAFTSEYGEYESKRGAAYYELSNGEIIQNPGYDHVPGLRKRVAGQVRKKLPLPPGPLYAMIGDDILEFLNYPEKYPSLFRGLP
jgi:glucose-6-phosphate isomerase